MGDFILRSPSLSKVVVPVANQFVKLAGYRQLGLKFDDIIAEENNVAQLALKRIPEDESYSRAFRIIRAHQTVLTHHLLPQKQWIKAEEDTPYLLPYLLEAEAEIKEKEDLDNLQLTK